MIELTRVTLEQAKKLKNIGFPQDCVCDDEYYCEYCNSNIRDSSVNKFVVDTTYAAPALEIVTKWLREEKNIHIEVSYNSFSKMYECYIQTDTDEYFVYDNNDNILYFSTYEDAMMIGIEEVLITL